MDAKSMTGTNVEPPRRQPQPAGVFDRHNEQPALKQAPNEEKEEFPDPFKIRDEMIKNLKKPKPSREETDVGLLNEAMNSEQYKEDEDMMKISDEDLALAEQLIFRGYAENKIIMSNFPTKSFVICSTSGEELSLIDEMAFDKMKTAKVNNDGTIDMPDSSLKALRNSLFIALSYRGVDGGDIATEPIVQINTLKKAILKLSDLYTEGELKQAEDLKTSIKKALLKRAALVKRMPSPMIDFLTEEKVKFDVKMLNIMTEKKILPKS